MKNKIVFTLLAIMLISSCNTKFHEQSDAFNSYLLNQFHEKIPSAKHTYVVHSQFGCYGCVKQTFSLIDKLITKNQVDFISILTYDSTFLIGSLKNNCKVLFDKNAKYEQIGLDIANITLIKTLDGNIIEMEVISLNDIEDKIKDEFN
jgi:hypothetical protein